MRVAETGDRRAAAGVEIAPTVGVDHVSAVAADGDRRVHRGVAVKHMRHGGGPPALIAPKSNGRGF